MKYYIVSLILHICLIFILAMSGKKQEPLQNVGKKIPVNMTTFKSEKNSGKSEDLSLKKNKPSEPRPENKEKIKEEKKKKEKKIVKKKTEEKPEPKPVENKKTVKIPEEEKPQEKKETLINEEEITANDGNDTEKDETPQKNSPTPNHNQKPSEKNDEMGEGFVQLDDGSLAAKHQGIEGLSYGFISKPDPGYPVLAKKLGYRGEMVVKVRLLINEEGKVQEIKFYTKKDKYGFCNEVEKTVSNWKLTPVKVGNKTVKMYLFKSFRFKIEK